MKKKVTLYVTNDNDDWGPSLRVFKKKSCALRLSKLVKKALPLRTVESDWGETVFDMCMSGATEVLGVIRPGKVVKLTIELEDLK